MPRSPQKAPKYALYREVSANDSLPITDEKQCINMSGYKTANIQIVPVGGANPTAIVQFWSDEATKFVQEHTPISKAGVGANTPFEFSVDCNSRKMFVAISGLTVGTVKIFVSGFDLQHPE